MLLFCGCDTTNKLYRFKIFFFTILQGESYLYGCHWPLETDQMTETKLVRGRIDSEELTVSELTVSEVVLQLWQNS